MQRVFQPNFSGGIISDGMYARSDTTKYSIGVKDAVNMLIRPQGGMANRSGFRLASGFDTGTDLNSQWLIPFALNGEAGIHLEFAENVFRVIQNGAYVLDSTFTEFGIDRITFANPSVIEIDADPGTAMPAVGELIYIADPAGDHALGEQVLRVTGVTITSPGTPYAAIEFEIFDRNAVDTSAGTGTWGALGAGAELFRVAEFDHPYDIADVPFVRYAQDRLDLYLAHRDYDVQKFSVGATVDVWTVAAHAFEPGIDALIFSTPTSAGISGITAANPPVVTTSAAHGYTTGTTVFLENIGGMTEVDDEYFTITVLSPTTFSLQDLSGNDVDGTGYTAFAASGTDKVSSMLAKPESTASGTTYKYVVTALEADSLEESLASTVMSAVGDVSTVNNIICWIARDGAALYNIYRETASGFGYVGTVASTIFTDTNIEPDGSVSPPEARNPFDGADNKPGIISFFEQRLALASTKNDPAIIELSKTNSFGNFSISYPSKPDDALRFRLRTRQLNDLRGIVSGRALYLLSTSTEWVVTGNDNEGSLSPTSIVPRPESYWGAYDIEPLTVGNRALFLEPSGNVVRDFLLTLNPNAESQTRDLTILVRELFDQWEITSWCYTQSPDRMVWVTLSNGDLLSLCYMEEHDIWGWTRHEIGGSTPYVYQVSCVREGARDVLYAVIGRATPSGEVIMTERLDERRDDDVEAAYFVDAGLTYLNEGSPASTFAGLLHLRGQSVVALVNGDVVEDLVVNDAGVVDLGDISGDHVHIGLAYDAYLETLPVDFETDELGSMRGRFKAASEVAIALSRSRGISAGTSLDRMNELIEWDPSLVGGPIPLETKTINITVDSDWVRDATVIVRQAYPLPATILGIAPIWALGE